jgi:hypothetical protein
MTHGVTVVVLNEVQLDAGGREFRLVPGLEEIAARIAEHARFDQHHFRQ